MFTSNEAFSALSKSCCFVQDFRAMKLPLATGLLSAAIFAGGCATSSGAGTATTRYVMRVDRTFDRSGQPQMPSEELTADSYRSGPPADRWDVSIEGSRVILTPIGQAPGGVTRLEGNETAGVPGERRFELHEGAFAGGRFVVRGDEAELTMFGSGVPIVSSERGKLVGR
jgi:hypothetical protein